MRRPAVRWSVLAVAVAAAAGFGYWAATLEGDALAERRALATAVADGRALQASLADARRALSAMASPGQAAVSWSRQATASIEAARTRLTALANADGGASLSRLNERIERLIEAERRVRENAVGGRTLMASDVAFGEALPHVDAIDSAVAEAVAAMTLTTDRAVAATRDSQLLAIFGALGVLGLAALVLTPLRAPETASSVAGVDEPAPVAGTPAAADDELSLRPPAELHPGASIASAQAPWSVQPASGRTAPEPRAIRPTSAPAMLPVPDLAPLATACDALAGLADADALPAALESARLALGARGVVVWLANADRTALSVVASAGYDRRVIERFPSTHVNDSNPTSRAFASGTPTTTLPGAGQPAALAVAIGGARGRTGVLSAELVDGAVADAQVIARARIVAAQLATLLEPAPPSDHSADTPAAARAEEA
jgi:hypothetical protein